MDQAQTPEDQDRTRQLTSGTQPKNPDAKEKLAKLVADLGFRFRPANSADMQAHAHTLRLLVDDLAEIPVRWLEEAARKWAVSKAFLPKASELIMMARECREESRRSNPSDTIDGETMAQRGNRLMNAANYDRGVRWYDDGKGGAFLGFLPEPTSGASRAPAQETDHSGSGEL